MKRSITSHCLLLGMMMLLLMGCHARPASQRTEDLSMLQNIWLEIAEYAESHHEETPDDLSALIGETSHLTANHLYVKGDSHRKKWRYLGKTKFDANSDQVLIESTQVYKGDLKVVLLMNGHAFSTPAKH
jgi:hypothetical protein